MVDAGRLAARYILAEVPELKLVHVNDLAAIESAAYLLKFDSVHGELRVASIWSGPLTLRLIPSDDRDSAGSWAKEGLRAENGVLEISMKGANIKVGYSSQEDPQQVRYFLACNELRFPHTAPAPHTATSDTDCSVGLVG